MQTFPFTREEVKFFKELNRHKIPYIIVGLSAASLQGAPIVTKDVDVWFKDLNDPKLRDIFKKCGISYIPPFGANPPALAGKGIELIDIVTHVHGVKEFDTEYARCTKIRSARIVFTVLPLTAIIKSKEFLKREKDRLVLPALRDTLIANREKNKHRSH